MGRACVLMADLNKPIVSSSIESNEPNDRPYEPNSRSMIWWSLAGLATLAMLGGVIYDMGDGTRTTASPSSTEVPVRPNSSKLGR
jgi:hypothetical protein